jgi:hypothetical protein
LARDGVHGNDWIDWFTAERELIGSHPVGAETAKAEFGAMGADKGYDQKEFVIGSGFMTQQSGSLDKN